jgi:hypothetical protein
VVVVFVCLCICLLARARVCVCVCARARACVQVGRERVELQGHVSWAACGVVQCQDSAQCYCHERCAVHARVHTFFDMTSELSLAAPLRCSISATLLVPSSGASGDAMSTMSNFSRNGWMSVHRE